MASKLESPFVGELPWDPRRSAGQPFINYESGPAFGEWERGPETEQDRFDGYSGREVDFLNEPASLESGLLEWESVESEGVEPKVQSLRQDDLALEAELGVGETPFLNLWELEGPDDLPADVSNFVNTLGTEWSRRRNGDPGPDAMRQWLLEDYRATLEGARQRWGKKYGQGTFTADAIGRGWMVSREECMKFQLGFPGMSGPEKLEPPDATETLVESDLVEDSRTSPVAPLAVTFVKELRRRYPSYMKASNYPRHGAGKWKGRGYCLDLYINGLDERGFYPRDEAIRFVRAVHDAATAVSAQWRLIYNDFSVAEPVNRALGRRHVVYVGNPIKTGGQVTGLNWHGPAPLILHFHLDIAPLKGAASTWRDTGESSSAPPATSFPASVQSPVTPAASPSSARPSAQMVMFAQAVLNAVQGERLDVDGILGPLTRAALERFRRQCELGSGGVLDPATDLALAQKAFEELAQQCIFARPGVRDTATDEALSRFRSERGLGYDATLDPPTRLALVEALRARTPSPAYTPSGSSPSATPSLGGGGLEQQMFELVRASWQKAALTPPELSQLGKMTAVKSKPGYNRYIARGLFVDDTALALRSRGLLSITDDDIDMLQRASNVETGGRLTALNSYDSAFMSVGFLQWTLKYRELQRWIAMTPESFRGYGIELEPTRKYVFAENHSEKAIVGAARAADLRSAEWGVRFYFASLDLDAVVAEYRHAVELCAEVRRAIVDVHGPVVTGHYNASPTLRALIQETRNNRPAYMKAAMVNAAARIKSASGVDAARFLEIVREEIRSIYASREPKEGPKKAEHIIRKTASRRLG